MAVVLNAVKDPDSLAAVACVDGEASGEGSRFAP